MIYTKEEKTAATLRALDRGGDVGTALIELEAEVATLKADIESLREREAACCPEDVPFDEFIATLKRQLAKAEKALLDNSGQIRPGERIPLHYFAEYQRERAAREQSETMVAALRHGLESVLRDIDTVAGLGPVHRNDFEARTIERTLADTAVVAAERDARIRRGALEEADQQWKDAMHALSEAAESWEVNGFALAVIVRLSAIRALLPPSPAESPE